jgi:2-polyprenyl-3-methyl-5-hydroxy-6-metoxy-1,4-benzoquinol methylase
LAHTLEPGTHTNITESPAKTCKLCGHTQFKVLFDREFQVLVCRNCGLIFLEDNHRDYRKYYSDEYDYRSDEGGYFTEKGKDNQAISKWIIKHLPKTGNTTLVEMGCGAGFLLKRLKDYGVEVSGIEPGKKAVEFARRINGIRDIECCMLEDIEETDRLYDAVILIQTFEHFADPLNSLLTIRGLLKRGGLLFIEVPNYYSPNGFYPFRFEGINYPSRNHLFVYSRETLGAFLRKAGFSVYRTSYTLQNIRMIARVDGDNEKVEFKGCHKVMAFYYVLPIITKAIDAFRFFKGKLMRILEGSQAGL